MLYTSEYMHACIHYCMHAMIIPVPYYVMLSQIAICQGGVIIGSLNIDHTQALLISVHLKIHYDCLVMSYK